MKTNQIEPLNEQVIIQTAVELTGVTEVDLRGGSSKRFASDVRKMCYYIIRNQVKNNKGKKISFESLGRLFHQRHSTVMSALYSFEDLVATDHQFKNTFFRFTQALGIENIN